MKISVLANIFSTTLQKTSNSVCACQMSGFLKMSDVISKQTISFCVFAHFVGWPISCGS